MFLIWVLPSIGFREMGLDCLSYQVALTSLASLLTTGVEKLRYICTLSDSSKKRYLIHIFKVLFIVILTRLMDLAQ
jgi:hypothetical protein